MYNNKSLLHRTQFLFSILALTTTTMALADLPKPGSLKIGNSIQASALVDTSYEYNFDNPMLSTDTVTTPQNRFRTYDRGHNQFLVNQATIGLSSTDENVLFDARLGFGSQISTLNNPENTGVEDAFKNVRRAYIGYQKHGWAFSLGKFDSGFGFEKVDSIDNWNYSRSLQFNSLQPIMLTGAHLAYQDPSGLGARLAVANGADRNYDNNRGKSAMLQVSYDKKEFAGKLGYFAGQEQAGKQYWRHTFNLNLKWMPLRQLGLGFDGTFVNGAGETVQPGIAAVSSPLNKAAQRYGTALYLNYQYATMHSISFRGEWVMDDDGVLNLRNKGAHLFAYTLTHRCLITSNLSFWVEARLDHATTQLYYDGGAVPNHKAMPTALVGMTFNI